MGAQQLHVLDGGIGAYSAAGGEVVRGEARWGMERQVRLVAGSLVVLGTALGLRFRPAGLLAGGVGAGLTVSALTDTCTMARGLSLLPYNRGPRDRSADEVLSELPALRSAA